MAHAYNEAGEPPDGMERVPILAADDSAVSSPEQLQGLLCMKEPTPYVQTTTVPKSDAEDEAQHVRVFSLQYRDFKMLMARAVVEDGPMVGTIVKPEREACPITAILEDGPVVKPGREACPRVSKIVQTLIPSAYPPRYLDHVQTCNPARCRLSQSVFLEPGAMASLSMEPSADPPQATPVLHTPELLELVLFHLDFKTRLISAPRVCKFWLETLNTSPLLQKASFFQPEKPSSPEEKPRLNPLLVEAFGEIFFNTGPEKPPARRAECFWKLPWSPQALLKLKAPTGSILSVEPTCRQKAFTRAGASWRKMLVSQPPPPFLGFMWLDDHPREPNRRLRIDSVNPPTNASSSLGVTMGQLYDTVQHFVMEQPYSGLFFRVRRDMRCHRKISRKCDSQDNSQDSDRTLETTNLVVDFHDDQYYLSMLYGPFNMEATRSVFQCKDMSYPVFGGKATIEDLDVGAFMNNSADSLELWRPIEEGEEYIEAPATE